mgnify:CR=1 FL=1
MRENRMLRSRRRVLETGLRQTLCGHEWGNPGYRQERALRATAPALDPTSFAILTTSATTSRLLRDRPIRRRFLLPSYLRATSRRYHPKIVSGVAIFAKCLRSLRLSSLPFRPSRRLCTSVNRTRRPPCCSRSTRFSSNTYASAAACFLSRNPATMNSRNLSSPVSIWRA